MLMYAESPKGVPHVVAGMKTLAAHRIQAGKENM